MAALAITGCKKNRRAWYALDKESSWEKYQPTVALFAVLGPESLASHLRFSARILGLGQFWRLSRNSTVTTPVAHALTRAAPLEAGTPLKAEAEATQNPPTRRYAGRRVDDLAEPGKGVALKLDRYTRRVGHADGVGRADEVIV